MTREHVVACLAGCGTSPELMAEASLALDRVSRLHGFSIEELHASFGADARARYGVTVPLPTRAALLRADAVLVASASDPAIADVQEELDLRTRITRVRFDGAGDLVIVSPLREDAGETAVTLAYRLAAERCYRLLCVEDGPRWSEILSQAESRRDDVAVERLRGHVALPAVAFEPQRFDVVVAGLAYGDALGELAAAGAKHRVAAHGLISGHGPGLFLPAGDGNSAVAGQGVVDPSSMLLATSLMLGDGLGERSAAATLAGAVSAATASPGRSWPYLRRTTRERTENVLRGLQLSYRNAEYWEASA
jgi:isocitrate/isopropylmalate dehydrogenase